MRRTSFATSPLYLLASTLLCASCEGSDENAFVESLESDTAAESNSAPEADFNGASTLRDGIAPNPEIETAVRAFVREDSDAVFTWFNGQVDSFTTRPKQTIPDYARPTLEQLGLSTIARTPQVLLPPVDSAEHPNVGRNIDALGELAFADDEELADQVVDYVDWDRPSDELIDLEARAAVPIMSAFLQQPREVFGVDAEELDIAVWQTGYRVGAFGRFLEFQLMYERDEPVIGGYGLVQFDANWNVIAISRMIITPDKLPLEPTTALIDGDQATRAALDWPVEGCEDQALTVASAIRGVEPVAHQRVWEVELSDEGRGACHYKVSVDAGTGEVLNVSDEISWYSDAVIRRWGFTGGDQTAPVQLVTNGVYTRDASRLEHDFFYMMNDNQCVGAAQTSCSVVTGSTQCSGAWGTTNGSSYVRGTIDAGRDWSNYYPNSASETFGETNAYHWARWMTIWLKPALDAMGKLPNSTADYERALIIADVCVTGGSWYDSSLPVSTESNKGEGGGIIRLQHRTPTQSSSSFAACEGGACFDSTGTLQHEMNHFFLDKYMNVGKGIDCGNYNELKFTHEGILGSAIPQAFWHYYYSIGYNPANTDMLYHSNALRGKVHVDDASLLKLSDYSCPNNVNNFYTAGRVAGQVLWKIYHGKRVKGSTISSMVRPANDTQFLIIAYSAAELQAASTVKDRAEYANRVMQVLYQGGWSAADRGTYCDVWDTHELGYAIASQYCN